MTAKVEAAAVPKTPNPDPNENNASSTIQPSAYPNMRAS